LFLHKQLSPREWPYTQYFTSLGFPPNSLSNSIFLHKHQSEGYISHLDAMHNATPYTYFPVDLIAQSSSQHSKCFPLQLFHCYPITCIFFKHSFYLWDLLPKACISLLKHATWTNYL